MQEVGERKTGKFRKRRGGERQLAGSEGHVRVVEGRKEEGW